jgi:hypothetical protein
MDTNIGFAVTINISAKRVHDLLTTANETGSGYWVEIIKHEVPPILAYVTAVYALEDPGDKVWVASLWDDEHPRDWAAILGGTVTYWEAAGGDHKDADGERLGFEHVLTREKILSGLGFMASKYPNQWARFMSGSEDGRTADVFLQCCLLGKVPYAC